MSISQVELAEALCSALFHMPFAEFLGEDDLRTEEGPEHHHWFHLGAAPKDMRVTVIRPEKEENVRLLLEWRNFSADPRRPLRGSQVVRLETYAASRQDLAKPSEAAILRVLEVFRQVNAEEGVAGRIEKLQDAVDSEE